MEALKFDTTILENGIIQIPELAGLANSPIEISIVVKHKQPDTLRDTKQSQSIDEFFEKWAGFLKNSDTDKSKMEYLQEKYL